MEWALLHLTPEEWGAVSGAPLPGQRPVRDARGRFVTGNPVFDRLERELWEAVPRE